MSIFDIKYQDRAINIFQQAYASGRLSHAYIFAGPRGVGKSSSAIQLAKMLLCENRVSRDCDGRVYSDSCGVCQSCKLVDAGTHPDLHAVYRNLITLIPGKEKHKAIDFGIDVIRRFLIDKSAAKSNMNAGKVFIIYESHRLSRAAQNALLKTLEEPPDKTHLFLISETLSTLLPTIRSRSQTMRFLPLPERFIRERLSESGAGEEESQFLVGISSGQLGKALEFHQLGVYDLNTRLGMDLSSLDEQVAGSMAGWVVDESASLAGAMESVYQGRSDLSKPSGTELNRSALKLLLGLLGGFFRDALRYQLGFAPQSLPNGTQMQAVKALAARFCKEEITERIRSIAEAEKMINANVNVNLTLTDLFNRVLS